MSGGEPIRPAGLRRRLFQNFAILLSGSGGAALLSLFTVAIVARALSLTDFGTFVLLQTSALLIAGLFTFSTQQPVIKLGIAALEQGDTDQFERIVGMGLVADLASATGAAVAACALVLLAPELIGMQADRASSALIVAISLLFQGYRTSEGIFRAFNRFGQLGVIQIITAAVQLIVAAVLWWYGAPFIAFAVLAALIIALSSVCQLVGALQMLRLEGMRPRFRGIARSSDRKEFVTYCWSTWAAGSFDTVRQNGDTPLVGLLVSVEVAGVYNVARQLAGVLRKGVQIYASVLFPELATFAAKGDFVAPLRLLKRIFWISVGITGVLAAGASIGGGFALQIIFGPEFVAGHLALVLLFAAAGIQLISATYSMYVQTFDGPAAILGAYAIALMAFLVTIVPGLWAWGIAGAGLAQVVFFVVLTLACQARLTRATAPGVNSQ